MVSAEALGEKGRTVKCGKCSHSWFQEAARDSLDDLQKLVDNIQDDAPEAHNVADAPDMPRAAESSGQEIKLERPPELNKSREHAATSKQKKEKQINLSGKAWFGTYEREIAAFVSALAIVAVLVWIILSIARPMFAPVKSELMLDQIKFESSEQDLKGTFRIINLSEKEQILPAFKVFLLANNDRIVSTQLVKSETEIMKGESEIIIPFSFRAPPSVAAKIKVTSVE
jgi:hypothetical protein